MQQGVCLYPWDVVDDPRAPRQIADLGVGVVSLASSYHTIRAIAPHNPRRAVVDAHHAAVYFAPDPSWYAGLRLRPTVPTWVPPDAYTTAQQRLREAGLAVHAWTVLLHSTFHGREHPDLTIENAFGDRYPYALCPAHPEVRGYASALVGDLAHRLRPDAIELESWGYLGVVHGSHHDKVGLHLDPLHEYLMSLCFNPASQDAVASAGGDPERIRDRCRRQLRAYFDGEVAADPAVDRIGDRLTELLGARDAAALDDAREGVTLALLDDLRGALPADDPPRLLVHATPSPHRTGSAVGVRPATLQGRVDATMVPLFGQGPRQAADLVARLRAGGSGPSVVAIVPLFGPGIDGQDDVARLVDAVRDAGATGLRFYHWGLAPAERLAWIEGFVSDSGDR